MNNKLILAKKLLFEPYSLDENKIFNVLTSVLNKNIKHSDLYFQTSFNETFILENSIIKYSSYDIDSGFGFRIISDDKVGYSYSNDFDLKSIINAGKISKEISLCNTSFIKKKDDIYYKNINNNFYTYDNPLKSIDTKKKILILKDIDNIIRNKDNRVSQVNAVLSGSYDIIMIMKSDGLFIADIRPLVYLKINVIIKKNNKYEKGSCGAGGRGLYDDFFNKDVIKNYAEEALRIALLNIDAKPSPVGVMPVVLGSGWPGILLHESIGHGLEGDFIRKKSSTFFNRIDTKIASEECNIVDDATLFNKRGSLNIDDEGTITQCTNLVEKGILKNYLQDNLNSSLMGTTSTGNGRRESYSYPPIPRMTNTYMLNGNHTKEEIIKNVKNGIYAVNFDGGQVDITSGKFVFSSNESYLIKDGKIQHPIKGAAIIGDGPTVLLKIQKVGNDLKLDEGIGLCGKEGQNVPVSVGQPTLLVKDLIIGGTKNI